MIPIIHGGYLHELADAYLPASMDRKDPRVSPLYADLKGLPPALIQVGSAETLLEDATRFTAAAGAADVAVTLEVWPHMIHAWPLWNAHLKPGRGLSPRLGPSCISIFDGRTRMYAARRSAVVERSRKRDVSSPISCELHSHDLDLGASLRQIPNALSWHIADLLLISPRGPARRQGRTTGSTFDGSACVLGYCNTGALLGLRSCLLPP